MGFKIFGFEIKKAPQAHADTPAPQALAPGYESGGYSAVWTMPWDGEKNLGELGPAKNYLLDYQTLRVRSWQLYLESEICQTVFGRFSMWIIGAGLKLQAEPKDKVLLSEKITIDTEAFNNQVEERFQVYAGSPLADYSGMQSLHNQADEAFKNAIVGGDVLVILRYVDNQVKVQLVDGAHVGTPYSLGLTGGEYRAENGNIIRHGVELDERGQHVAFYVRTGTLGMDYERVEARSNGIIRAWLVYGLKYRLDNVRGLPLISAVMETAKKLERYKEATVGSAEERQKVAYTIEHDATSTGENPLMGTLAKVNGFGGKGDEVPRDEQGRAIAATVAATMNKEAFNMPIGSQMKQLVSSNELSFKDFYTVNIDLVCATINIPPNVAMSKYDSNFSASRAALKDWEHTIAVKREKFATQFYQLVYNFWLQTQVLANKVQAPGYLKAIQQNNPMAIYAYQYARWVGATVPHIDPVKEVMAERLKLGGLGANFPLTTPEAATETLNGGDSMANVRQFAREMEEAEELGIEKSGAVPAQEPDEDDKE